MLMPSISQPEWKTLAEARYETATTVASGFHPRSSEPERRSAAAWPIVTMPIVLVLLWWMTRGDEPFVDRLYDPVPTVTGLDVPSLWIFGGEDSSMPSQDSIDKLRAIQETGRPIEIEIFQEAEHGILLFTGGSSADRKYLGYAPGYLDLQVEWLRRQSGLTLPESVDLAVTVPADEEVDAAVVADDELDR